MDELYHHCSNLLIVSIPAFINPCQPKQVIAPELVSQPNATSRPPISGVSLSKEARLCIKAFQHRVKSVHSSIESSRFLNADRRLTYQFRILRVLGVLSILLPIILIAGSATFDNCTIVLASVSHYYYTSMGYVFLGVLYATGFALFIYKGDNRAEMIATRFASLCILVVALLPTSKDIYGCSTNAYSPNALGEELHKAFAAFFLLTMSTLFCLFARNSSMNKHIRSQNRVYHVCAGTIAVIVFTIVAMSKPGWLDQETQQKLLPWMTMYKPVFWLEWLALAAVGVSWLIRGQWLLADPMDQTSMNFADNSYQSERPASAKASVEEV